MVTEPAARFFCAEASHGRGEQIFATAPNVDVWFLLEYHGRWNADALPVSEFPAEVREWLTALTQRVKRSRVLLIRQSHLRRASIQFFVVHSRERDARAARFELSCYQDLFGLDLAGGFEHTDPLFLVCTHGKHDKCCSKFGFPLYRAMRELAGAQVWECTHVGGDRFAGNVIAMPQGAYYGHVFPEDAAALVGAQAERAVVLKHFRGRCCYGRIAQAGEYFVRSETGLLLFDELRFADWAALAQDQWRVRFAGAGAIHAVEFRRVRGEGSGLFTCHAEKAQGLSSYELVGYHCQAAW